MLYQVDTGSGLTGIKYINADNETEAVEKAKDILFDKEQEVSKPMANYNDRLDDVLDTLVENAADSDSRLGYVEAYEHAEKAKQALTSLIKELVEEAKPNAFKFDDGQNDATHFYNKAVSEYQHNLLKALEEE